MGVRTRRSMLLATQKIDSELCGAFPENACSEYRADHKRSPVLVSHTQLLTDMKLLRMQVHTQRKNKIVTRHSGYIDSLSVSSAARVRLSSLVFNDCFLKIAILSQPLCQNYLLRPSDVELSHEILNRESGQPHSYVSPDVHRDESASEQGRYVRRWLTMPRWEAHKTSEAREPGEPGVTSGIGVRHRFPSKAGAPPENDHQCLGFGTRQIGDRSSAFIRSRRYFDCLVRK